MQLKARPTLNDRPCIHMATHPHAKDENVVVANLLRNLHVGAVQRANDQGAVHGELHVACAAGLRAFSQGAIAAVGRSGVL
jgi:hypothetical protein